MATGVIVKEPVRRVTTSAILLIAAASSLAVPAAPLPRKSPEFTIVEPSGKTTLLSSFKGSKIVVIEFLFTRSPRCLNLVETLNKLNQELGARGFQPVAIAFGPDSGVPVLTRLADHFKLTYPFGYATPAEVDAFLGRQEKEVLRIPQMVLIDRSGTIRATSGVKGNPSLESENSLRMVIEDLLKESVSETREQKAKSGNNR